MRSESLGPLRRRASSPPLYCHSSSPIASWPARSRVVHRRAWPPFVAETRHPGAKSEKRNVATIVNRPFCIPRYRSDTSRQNSTA